MINQIYSYFIIICWLIVNISSIDILNRTNILLATSASFDVSTGCREILIPNNYKKLKLNLNSNNLNTIILTDIPITNCSENVNLSNCCNKKSTFCIENINPSLNDFRLNYCIDYTYLYACILPDTSNNSTIKYGSVSLITDVQRGEGCKTTEFIPETECSTLGIDKCRSPLNCTIRCDYAECRTDLYKPESKVFSLCIPHNYSDNQLIDRCNNYITFENTTAQPFRVSCNKTYDEDLYILNQPSHTFFKFLAVVFGVAILATFIASVYYRFKLSIDNVPPFDPPSLCPNFIFPRNSPY